MSEPAQAPRPNLRPSLPLALLCLLSISCAVLQAACDALQGRGPISFPLRPTLFSTQLLNVIVLVGFGILARQSVPAYRMFRPFAGGQAFAVLQGFMYLCAVVSMLITFGYVQTLQTHVRHGVLTFAAMLSLASHVLAATSVHFYDDAKRKPLFSVGEVDDDAAMMVLAKKRVSPLQTSPNRETIAVAVLQLFLIALCCAAYVAPRAAAGYCIFAAVATHVASGLVVQLVIGWTHTPSYRLFMPLASGLPGLAMQSTAWILYSAAIYVGIFAMGAIDGKMSAAAAAALLVAFVVMSVLCTTILLLFVRVVFDPSPSGKEKSTTSRPHRTKQSHSSSITNFATHGALFLTIASVMHACIVASLFALRQEDEEEQDGLLSFASYLWPFGAMVKKGIVPEEYPVVAALMESIRSGSFVVESLCAIFLLALPPCTHLVGRVAFGSEYELWQPFRGPLDFVLLQSAGWSCFGISIFFLILHLSQAGELGVLIAAAAAVLAQIFIHASLTAFAKKRPPTAGRSSATLAAMRSPSQTAVFLSGVHGEMLTGGALAILSFMLRLLCDARVLQRDDEGSMQDASMFQLILLLVSSGFFIASVPLAHVSVRHKGIAAFSPFAGGGEFIALQAIGWTLFSILVLCNMYTTGEHMAFLLSAAHMNSISSSHVVMSSLHLMEASQWLSCSMQAVINLVPFIVISLSVFVCDDLTGPAQRHDGGIEQRADALRAFVRQAASSPEERATMMQALEALVASGAGRRGISAAPSAVDGRSSAVSRDPRHHAATVVVTLMSLASGTAFVVAGVLVSHNSQMLSLVVGIGGLFVTVASCVGTHAIYGPFMHNRRDRAGAGGSEGEGIAAYKFFMPFEGGLKFVLLQAVGWGCLAACLVLLLLALLARKPSLLVLVSAGVLSVASQAVLVGSVAHFVPPSAADRKKLLEKNVEAAVAFLLFIASFLFSHVYTSLTTAAAPGGDGGAADFGDTPSSIANYIVPVVITTVATAFALPLSVIAIRRSAAKHSSDFFGARVDSTGRQTRSDDTTSVLQTISVRAADAAASIALLAVALLPVAIIYATYYAAHQYTPGVAVASYAWQGLLLVLAFAMGTTFLPSIPGMRWSPPRWLVAIRCSAITFVLYSLPTIVVVGSYSLPVLFPTSIGAKTFAVVITTLTIGASASATRKVCFAANFCVIGYATYAHIRHCIAAASSAESMPSLTEVVVDAVTLLFWIPYARRYHRKPHETGSLRSTWFLDVCRKYVFADVETYFHFRVVRQTASAAAEVAGVEEGCRPGCLYSFHPHGIFPGTALFCTLTNAWASSDHGATSRPITLHAASVIFNVPLMRDFLLALGGRVVTRKAIEASLDEGNSVLIVTGGQAEMMLSKSSAEEMHLVTHHQGFIKLAVGKKVPLVPLLCFAENNVMDNISMSWLQKRTLKVLGFPFPTVPYGRWYLPLPNRTPLTVVVGAAIYPEPGLVPEDAEGIERLARRYFESVRQLFYEHRAAAGYPHMELYLHHGLSRTNPKDKLKRHGGAAAQAQAAPAEGPATDHAPRAHPQTKGKKAK